jgi:acyl carrier protein
MSTSRYIDMTTTELTKEEITKQVIQIIAKEGMIEESRITPDAKLKSLDVDSIAIISILMAVEEKFNVYVPIDNSLSEVDDLKGLIKILSDCIQRSNA